LGIFWRISSLTMAWKTPSRRRSMTSALIPPIMPETTVLVSRTARTIRLIGRLSPPGFPPGHPHR
jgi:hypothetical protein